MKKRKKSPRLQLVFTSQTKYLNKSSPKDHSLYYLEPEEQSEELLRFPEDDVLIRIFEKYGEVKVLIEKRFRNKVQVYVPKGKIISPKKKGRMMEEIQKETEVIPRILF